MKIFLILFLFLFVASCGNLKLSPQGCKTPMGYWGDEKFTADISLKKTYRVWFDDLEIKFNQLLKENNLNCSQIAKMRVIIEQKMMIDRIVTIEFQKK